MGVRDSRDWSFCLILALLVAVLQSVLIMGAARNNYSWISIARPAAFAQLLFVAISYLV